MAYTGLHAPVFAEALFYRAKSKFGALHQKGQRMNMLKFIGQYGGMAAEEATTMPAIMAKTALNKGVVAVNEIPLRKWAGFATKTDLSFGNSKTVANLTSVFERANAVAAGVCGQFETTSKRANFKGTDSLKSAPLLGLSHV